MCLMMLFLTNFSKCLARISIEKKFFLRVDPSFQILFSEWTDLDDSFKSLSCDWSLYLIFLVTLLVVL